MSRTCPQDSSEVFSDDEAICRTHLCPLVTVVASGQAVHPPVPGTPAGPAVTGTPVQETGPRRAAWSASECWRCGQPSPNPANVECLNPDCHRSLTPPAMHIAFPAGEVELQPGESVNLGRQGPHGRVFRDHPNVSRRHAAVGVDEDGRAWVVPFAVSNGTFVNDTEIQDSINRSLVSGDRIRFAAGTAVGTVTLYDR